MIGVRIKVVVFLIFLINLLIPSVAFAKGGRVGGIGEGIISFGDSGFQINDPVMFCLYMALGIILVYSYLKIYGTKRKVNALEGEMRQRAYESWNLKNMEIRYRNDSNNGYLVCEECNGYFMLEKGEYPHEFDSCQCGGNLIYHNDLDEFLEDDDFKIENKRIIN